MDETSFQTLEALGAHVANKIVSDFRPHPDETDTRHLGWQVKVTLEKPTAVPFADAPAVTIRLGGHIPPSTQQGGHGEK